MTKIQSNFEGKILTKSMSNALKPFPTVDPEFYQETSTAPNFFWQKEMTRATSERSIMNKTFQSERKNDGNMKVFYNSEVFIENRRTKKLANTDKYNKQPKNVTIDLYRARDYHSHTNVLQTDKSKNDEDFNRRNANKAISPMHLKLYSSTMQQNSSKDISLPISHPSYNKDPVKKDVIPASQKKRLDTLKTNYNFLKCYY